MKITIAKNGYFKTGYAKLIQDISEVWESATVQILKDKREKHYLFVDRNGLIPNGRPYALQISANQANKLISLDGNERKDYFDFLIQSLMIF